jgi:hypothetical protein
MIVYDFTKLSLTIQFWTCILMCPLSLYANIVNIVVCVESAELQKLTISFYNTLMSLFNILSLIFGYFLLFLPTSIGQVSLLLRSDYACKLIPFVICVSLEMSALLSLMVTLERLLRFAYRDQYNQHRGFKFLTKREHLRWTVLVIFCVVCTVNAPMLFNRLEKVTAFDRVSNGTVTQIKCTSAMRPIVRDSIVVSLRCFLPFVLKLIINSV